MRTIRFRMWTGHKMLMPFDPQDHQQIIACLGQQMSFDNAAVTPNPYNHNNDGTIFLQYIGVIGKKKRPICEGDIVRWDDNSNGKYWRVAKVVLDPDIQLQIIENTMHELSTWKGDVFHFGNFMYANDGDLEVMGNIYENSNLLI